MKPTSFGPSVCNTKRVANAVRRRCLGTIGYNTLNDMTQMHTVARGDKVHGACRPRVSAPLAPRAHVKLVNIVELLSHTQYIHETHAHAQENSHTCKTMRDHVTGVSLGLACWLHRCSIAQALAHQSAIVLIKNQVQDAAMHTHRLCRETRVREDEITAEHTTLQTCNMARKTEVRK